MRLAWNAYSRPQNWGFWGCDPKIGSSISATPLRHSFMQKDVIWHTDLRNWSTSVTTMWDQTHTHTHTQPFYGSHDFVYGKTWWGSTRKNCFTKARHSEWQFMCLTLFFHSLSPSLLWSTSWPGTLNFILHTFLHPIIVFFSQYMPIPSQPVLL